MRFLLLLLLGFVTPLARAADVQVLLQRQATACAKSLLSGDYDTFAAYTHPRIVAAMGGKAAMVDRLKTGTEQMKAQGIAFETATVAAAAAPFSVQAWLLAYVPMQLVMRVPNGLLKHRGMLLGISEDQGLHWTFIDLTGNIPPDAFFKVFPELVGQVQFPPHQGDEFEPGS